MLICKLNTLLYSSSNVLKAIMMDFTQTGRQGTDVISGNLDINAVLSGLVSIVTKESVGVLASFTQLS